MLHQCRISALVAGTMMLLTSGVSAAEQCPKGEQPLEFRFFTDSNSWKDNGWILECDSKDDKRDLVWSIPIGSLEIATQTEVIREAACVPDTSTCTLNIFDASGDGLQGGKNKGPSASSFAGWFAFLHGHTTVATYKSLEDQKFTELTYCVGPNCDQVPQDVHEDCQDIVYLAMQLDNNPADTSYQLVCGGEDDGVFDKQVIWNGSGFTEAGAFVEEETCLPKDACCEFIVVDGNSNGLTETVKTTRKKDGAQAQGFIYLEKNFDPVLEYDGSTGETFGVLTKQFGCAADKEVASDEKEDIKATVVVDVPEDDKEEEEEEEDIFQDSVEVGDNVEGVFNFNPDDNTDYFINTDSTLDPSGTFPPTTEDWVSDDDYQNFNDDGQGFGSFNDVLGFFGDDVFRTEMPTLVDSQTWAPTFAPTSIDISEERESWELYDDVVDDDDVEWTMMDDLNVDLDGMTELDNLIKDLDDHTVKLQEDPNAVKFLNGDSPYGERKVGLTKNAKIVIGVLVPLFFFWTIGLVGCYYYGPKETKSEEASNDEQGTTGAEADSNGSISESEQSAVIESSVV